MGYASQAVRRGYKEPEIKSKDDALLFIGDHCRKFHKPPLLDDFPCTKKDARKFVSQLVKDGYIKRGVIRGKKRSKA